MFCLMSGYEILIGIVERGVRIEPEPAPFGSGVPGIERAAYTIAIALAGDPKACGMLSGALVKANSLCPLRRA